jgi:hypothetical protein
MIWMSQLQVHGFFQWFTTVEELDCCLVTNDPIESPSSTARNTLDA